LVIPNLPLLTTLHHFKTYFYSFVKSFSINFLNFLILFHFYIYGRIGIGLRKVIFMFNLGILTVSDKGSQGQRYDASGETIRNSSLVLDNNVLKYEVIPDEVSVIASKLTEWADEGQVDVILTTGGTGLGPRDVTPEATLSIVDKVVPGFTEAMRFKAFDTTPFAILSRAVAGVRGKCFIINLPGSTKAVRECLEIISPAIPHAVEILTGEVTEHTTNTGKG
jgi:molybdenum cofactor synthesis domain-containing protein